MKKPPRPKAQSESRRQTMEKLLDSGLKLFSKKGFDAASTKLVAEKARVNEALIYRYFGDKNKFFAAVVGRCIEAAEQQLFDAPILDDLEKDICQHLVISYEHDVQHKEFIRMGVQRSLIDPKMRKRLLEQIPLDGSPKVWERLKNHQKAGRLRKDADVVLLSKQLCLFSCGLMLSAVAMEGMAVSDVQIAIREYARMFAKANRPTP